MSCLITAEKGGALKPLSEFLAHIPLRFEEVVHLGKQVALAIENLRANGMAHLNLSPATIFVDGTDLTTATVSLSGHSHPLATSVAVCDILEGSQPYSAPEVLGGRCDGAGKSDMWSLGLTMLVCVDGWVCSVLKGHTGQEMLRRNPFSGISDCPPMAQSEITEKILVEGLVSAHVDELVLTSSDDDQVWANPFFLQTNSLGPACATTARRCCW